MPGFIENALEAVACLLQTTLHGPRTHVKRLGNDIDRWTMPDQPVLNRAAHQFDKRVFRLELLQLFFKLWRKQIEQFSIAGNEGRSASAARKLMALREAPLTTSQPKWRSNGRRFGLG